jgi:hypothetical protein
MLVGFIFTLLMFTNPVKGNDFIYPPDDGRNHSDLYNSKDCRTKRMATIDLLFVQEPQFSGLEQRTDQWLRSVNEYFRKSRIYLKVRKAGLVDYEFKSKNMRDKLGELRTSKQVKELRDEYKADFVQGIVDKSGNDGAVGIAFLTTDAAYAFSVVQFGTGPITVGHELGHNLGLGHSVLQGSKGDPYKWGRGHGVKDKFGTIMTYAFLYPAPRVDQFSNPQLRCAGVRCGVGGNHSKSANSARAVNCVRFKVSRHR